LRNALAQLLVFFPELLKFFPQNGYFPTFLPTQFFLTGQLFQVFTGFLQVKDCFIHGSSASFEHHWTLLEKQISQFGHQLQLLSCSFFIRFQKL